MASLYSEGTIVYFNVRALLVSDMHTLTCIQMFWMRQNQVLDLGADLGSWPLDFGCPAPVPCYYRPHSFFVLVGCKVFVLHLTVNWAKRDRADNKCLFSSNKSSLSCLPCRRREVSSWVYERTHLFGFIWKKQMMMSVNWDSRHDFVCGLFFFFFSFHSLIILATCHSVGVCWNTALRRKCLVKNFVRWKLSSRYVRALQSEQTDRNGKGRVLYTTCASHLHFLDYLQRNTFSLTCFSLISIFFYSAGNKVWVVLWDFFLSGRLKI